MHRLLPPPGLRPRAGAVLLVVALVFFALLAADLRLHGPVTTADPGISNWFHGRMHPAVTRLLLGITHLHSTRGLGLMTLALAAFLYWKKQLAWLGALALCVPGGQILNAVVKQVFERARPSFEGSTATLGSYSFPSGHTSGATVWWGFVLALYFAWERRPRRRAAALAGSVVMVLLTATSRVYLGVHYPSDVLAAAAEGVAWLALCFMAIGRAQRSGPEPEPRP